MVPWITTEQHCIWVGNEYKFEGSDSSSFENGITEWYYYTPDLEALQKQVAKVIATANYEQKEVKAVVPLQGSDAHTV